MAPILAVLTSVVFNVWYGVAYIEPLLTPRQHEFLRYAVVIFNLVVFPLAGLVWGVIVASLRGPLRAISEPPAAAGPALEGARARAINLPWHFALIVALANVAVVVVVYAGVHLSGDPVYAVFDAHLVIAVTIAALITITIAFFLVELLVQVLIFPLLFSKARPYETRGALPLSLPLRALLMAIAGGIGPITMLLLLGWADDLQRGTLNFFRLAVGVLGMSFAFVSAWLFGGLVVAPIQRLSQAARAVAGGNLSTRVQLLRADEFGALVDEFNRMISELREKQRLRETFGLHVGAAAAEQILARDPGLGGQAREVTVLFCDIRNFTARTAAQSAEETVAWLNRFFTAMVEIVESRHGGMVNKFLGDGFMALFGAGGAADHASQAVRAGRDMLAATAGLDMQIGVGIHTGPAIVGNIGSAQRLEFTAIGDTVNLASRTEGLTKSLKRPLLFTEATRARLGSELAAEGLGRHAVKGLAEPVAIYTLAGV
ncbi:MAG: adenylate/guanylate cyclase domain-containing protein [Nevskiales bacterium]